MTGVRSLTVTAADTVMRAALTVISNDIVREIVIMGAIAITRVIPETTAETTETETVLVAASAMPATLVNETPSKEMIRDDGSPASNKSITKAVTLRWNCKGKESCRKFSFSTRQGSNLAEEWV